MSHGAGTKLESFVGGHLSFNEMQILADLNKV